MTGRKPFQVLIQLALIMIWGSIPARASESFSLEDVLSYAFPSHLTASPAGDLVAWVFNQEGRRNIWCARGPEYKPLRLTDYDADDGQELGGLMFNSDGGLLVYVRGGNANRAGEFPNPTSDPLGVEQSVWVIPTAGGQPRRIGEGNDPVTAPTGGRMVYSRGGGLMLADLESQIRPKPLFKARGRNGSPVWSPDGKRLAFVSSRDEHAYIGIYDFEPARILWMEPSVDRDEYPVWSPDGTAIAFIRIPALAGSSFQGAYPFDLMVGRVSTLKAEKVWSCPNPTGGFAQYYPAKTLRWAAGDHLVFYSEHESWMHLYAYSLKGRRLIPLSPGSYEVEDSILSRDGRRLIYNANAGDIDRRHLWSVSVTGGTPRALTSGEGLEWGPMLTAVSGDLLFLCSTAVQPAAPALIPTSGGDRRLIAPDMIPDRFPADRLVIPRPIVIKAPDGTKIHCQLFSPKKIDTGDGLPAVIFMHGGPIRQMMPGWHMRGYYHNAYAMNQYLAELGYVVLSVNYRSGIGYGRDFRTAPKQGPRGASEYQDIVAAGRWLQNRPEIDPNKIGLWGGSYGGYLTAMGLARDSELFAAGVDLHGVHDWSLRGRRRGGGGWGIQGEDLMSTAFQSSPVADVDFWTSPVLFVHGDDDRNVDFIQTTDLVQRLRGLGKAPIELMIIPDEVHGFLRHDIWIKVYRKAVDFFERRLKNRS